MSKENRARRKRVEEVKKAIHRWETFVSGCSIHDSPAKLEASRRLQDCKNELFTLTKHPNQVS